MVMTLVHTLVALVLGLIVKEAPNVARSEGLKNEFERDITQMLAVHEKVAVDGHLVDPGYDFLLLAAVNYRENRMRLPAPDGDCGWSHKYSNLPSGQWPDGYKPTIKRMCNSVGPMQVNKGLGYSLFNWAEVRSDYPGKLTEENLRDTETNVTVAYDILQHWKNTCKDRDGTEAPVSVWLAAYRQGKCPHYNKGHGYYIDAEARTRCAMANSWASALAEDEDVIYTGARDVPCTYKERAAAK